MNFTIGQQVELKDKFDERNIGLRKYDTVFFSLFGTVVSIIRNPETEEIQSYLVKF